MTERAERGGDGAIAFNGAAVVRDLQLLTGCGVLVCVAELGNFSRAAEHLGMTQSGVSKAVARLEERLGTRLLHRHARTLRLTAEGSVFVGTVKPALLEISGAVDNARHDTTGSRGRIRVAADIPAGRYLLAPGMRGFLEARTGVSVELVVRPELGDLVADDLDLAIRFGPPVPSGLVTRKIAEARVITCASPAYVAARGAPSRPEDLASDGHDCILLIDAETGRPFEWEFERGGECISVAVHSRFSVSDPVSRVAACRSGFGVCQMLDLYGRRFIEEGSLVQLLPDWSEEVWPLYAYLPTGRHVSARVRALLDHIVRIARDGLYGCSP